MVIFVTFVVYVVWFVDCDLFVFFLFLLLFLCPLYYLPFVYIFILLVLVSDDMALSIYVIWFSHEISHNDRISPTKELGSSLWRGGSASPARGPNVRTQPLSSITSTLGSAKGQGLKFLQSSRDTLNQPVPTASYRSYRWDSVVFCGNWDTVSSMFHFHDSVYLSYSVFISNQYFSTWIFHIV